ncbi:MAG: hypothetical protein Q4F34_05635, partial [Prevotellaceae bacterium]|nr:hypothetical protein [Prevotellaceae bacterium]
NTMKNLLFTFMATIVIAFSSCDTPHTMAWNHYYYAQSKFDEGDLETAERYAMDAKGKPEYKENSSFATKVDDLLNAINQAYNAADAEQKN